MKPSSSVLVIGRCNKALLELGVDSTHSYDEALDFSKTKQYGCLLLELKEEDNQKSLHFLDQVVRFSPMTQKIIYSHKKFNLEQLQLFAQGKIDFLIEDIDSKELQDILHKALERYSLLSQQKSILHLFDEQNKKLLSAKSDLESRIKKREKALIKSKKRLEIQNQRVRALHGALLALSQAQSIGQMETLLIESLKSTYNLSWLRILFSNQSQMETQLQDNQKTAAIYKSTLSIGSREIGKIYFATDSKKSFSKSEKEFLQQVADSVSLAIDRISQREKSDQIKQQWESTFNSISDPICITDQNYRLLQTNHSFYVRKKSSADVIYGLNAFETFLGSMDILSQIDTQPTSEGIEWTLSSLADNETLTYQITIHEMEIEEEDLTHPSQKLKVILFHDISEQKQLERQILETSKMSELGTISSSIAHEINNPLGGMISFLQLIQMEADPKAEYTEDIKEMYEAALRCKSIVENLLGFSRKSQGGFSQTLDIQSAMEDAIKITDLQTRSTNINLEMVGFPGPLIIAGNSNQLTQAFCNILQNSVEAIQAKIKTDPKYDGQIRVVIKEGPKRIEVTISDNGIGMDSTTKNKIFNPLFTLKNPEINSGLGLTVAFQIIKDHGGGLEYFSQPMAGTAAKISFQRPDLRD